MKHFLIICVLIVGCGTTAPPQNTLGPKPVEQQTLSTLRVIIHAPTVQGLPRAGSPVDRELALIELFAQSQKLTLEYVPVTYRHELMDALLSNKGDVIAAQFTRTPSREKQASFSAPIRHVSEWVVVAAANKNAPQNINDLQGKQVWLRPTSSFLDTVTTASSFLKDPIKVKEIKDAIDTDELLYRVGQGQYGVTVADSNAVNAYQSYRNDIKVAFPLKKKVPIAWAVDLKNAALLKQLNAFLGSQSSALRDNPVHTDDLPGIQQRGRLRVAMPNNASSYFLHGGVPMGHQYQLAREMAKSMGLYLEIIVPRRQTDLLDLVEKGHADVVAATLSINDDRKKQATPSIPITKVDEVLVQHQDSPSITALSQLNKKTVHARKSSSYWETLTHIKGRVPQLKLVASPESSETQTLVAQVRDGKIPMTVADFDIVAVGLAFGEPIKTTLTLRKGQERAFWVRKDAPKLLAAVNTFVNQQLAIQGQARKVWSPVRTHIPTKQPPKPATKIETGSAMHTPFDADAAQAGKQYSISPKLLLAIAEVTSKFDANKTSLVGERGLMQLRPTVASKMGLPQANLYSAKDNLMVAAKYLNQLMSYFKANTPQSVSQKLALAAYKVGVGHVDDARRLAKEQLERNPSLWKGHVADALKLLSQNRYAKHARNGYCRGVDAVEFVEKVTRILAR